MIRRCRRLSLFLLGHFRNETGPRGVSQWPATSKTKNGVKRFARSLSDLELPSETFWNSSPDSFADEELIEINDESEGGYGPNSKTNLAGRAKSDRLLARKANVPVECHDSMSILSETHHCGKPEHATPTLGVCRT